MRVLLTGANGFVGRAVAQRLLAVDELELRGAFRHLPASLSAGMDACQAADLGPDADWRQALAGVDIVVHCAARVHVMHESESDPLAVFRRTNVEGTLRLARQAIEAGVRRFIYLSSIKVNGEQTRPGVPFRADDSPAPVDAYGQSKLEAEQGLLMLAQDSGLEVVIIRPPLVYGAGVKANFLNMMRWLKRGIPLPLGAINNRRSLVAASNLADLVALCLCHPAATGQVFLVSDGEDLSTTDLLRRLAKSLERRTLLLPVSPFWLELVATCLGQKATAQRLCSWLQVDISKTCELLSWQPPVSVDQALAVTARQYLDGQQ